MGDSRRFERLPARRIDLNHDGKGIHGILACRIVSRRR
jgi:hypothetical protein